MLMLTLHLNFFAHCTNDKSVEDYLKDIRESIYICMELSKMSYIDILYMPVFEFREYINWKIKYDKDREEAQAKAMDQMKK